MKTKKTLILTISVVLAFVVSGHAQITFTKITTGAIVTDTGNFTRCVWGDFHNSGFLDLFVCNYNGTNVFYQNNGDGTFRQCQ